MKAYFTRVLVLVFLVVLGMAANSWATLTYELGTVFANQPSMLTDGPWLTANFETTDQGVQLTVEPNNLPTGGYLNILYFNFSGTLPTNLQITSTDNAFKSFDVTKNADGGGQFDIIIYLFSSEAERVASGDTITFLIKGTGISTESQFNDKSDGGTGSYYMAAHIAGYGPPGGPSTFIGTPIPPSAWLLGSSLIGLLGIRRKRINNFFT